MRGIIIILLAFIAIAPRVVALTAGEVAVLYNSSLPESRQLAVAYAEAREIPRENLIGLAMPDRRDVSRQEYESQIRDPLRNIFDRNQWWKRALESSSGITLPVENHIRAIAIMRGTPLRIRPTPRPDDAPPPDPRNPIATRDEASVDSELALFGLDGVPTHGVLQNRYHNSELPFTRLELPFMVLTTRIDGPCAATCQRLILDAIETEKSGLWGNAYIDIAHFHAQGDTWLENIANANDQAGIPTIIDRFKPTLPSHYPMGDAALYYGWYDHQVSGPFLNPEFRLRRGAIAVHIHSFSAAQLDNAARNWVAPILASGAAATLGNVHEPYLHLSHHLDVFHDRLLRGFTFAEAAWAANPAASWQAVAIGDPLYRPFARFPDGGDVRDADLDFRALAMARKTWPENRAERRTQIAKAIERTRSATLAEALALDHIATGESTRAADWLDRAATLAESPATRIRLAFHHAAIHRHQSDHEKALDVLRAAAISYPAAAETKALDAWIDTLAPPPAEAEDGTP